MGPLAGIKVIELEGLGPAPLAGQILADLGADLVLIGRTSSDHIAHDPSKRGKKSIALNLKKPSAIAAVKRLVAISDVLIEGFRPGVMERLGLGPDICEAENPGLVYARMTGWGQTGPLAPHAGHDINYLALTGALNAMGKRGQPPVPPLNLVADFGGGTMFLLLGILAALIERQKSGKGQVIDCAMTDGVPVLMSMLYGRHFAGVWNLERENNILDGAAPFYRCYETSDAKFVSIGCLEPQFYAEFLRLTGVGDPVFDEQYNRDLWPEQTQKLTALFKTRTRDQWSELLQASDACFAPVLDYMEAVNHPHYRARQTHVEADGMVQPAPAPKFSRTAPDTGQTIRPAGVDSVDVLQGAGLTSAEIAAMRADGALT